VESYVSQHAAFEVLGATVLRPSDQPDLDNKLEIKTYGGGIQMKSLKKLTMVLFLGLALLVPGSSVAADDTKKSPAPAGLVQEEAKKDAVTEQEVPKSDAKLPSGEPSGESITQKTTPDSKGLPTQSK
jgi:hypothetical protein